MFHNRLWALSNVMAALTLTCAAQSDAEQSKVFSEAALEQLIHVPSMAVLAQQAAGQDPVEVEEEIAQEIDLFETMNIDLVDLEKLRENVEVRFGGEDIRLSLMDSVHRSLGTNHDILITEYEPLRARANLRSTWGDFDPVLNASATYTEFTQSANAQTVAFGGITSIQSWSTTTQLSLDGFLPWGTQYSFFLNIDKEETTFNRFVEEFSGGAGVTLTQPILRGNGLASNFSRVRIARNNFEISHAQLEQTLLNTVAEVIRAYWDLVGAIETLRVRQKSLTNAQNLFDINERRLELGMAAVIDVLQAKAGVAARYSDVIAAHVGIADAEDRLKQLLDMRGDGYFSPDGIIPTDRPNVVAIPLEERLSMDLARRYRPEMRLSELEIENAVIDQKRARNDLLPQFDASITYSQGGRNHKLRQVFRAIQENDDDTLSISLQGSLPIGNRTARGAYQNAKLTTRQAERRLLQTETDLMLNVRRAMRSVISSEALVASNNRARIIQEANVAAEEKKLRLGTTTSQNVLELEEDLTLAETQEVQSMTDYEKALIDLQLAEGTLLSNLGIAFEGQEEVPPVSYWQSVFPLSETHLGRYFKSHEEIEREREEYGPPPKDVVPLFSN